MVCRPFGVNYDAILGTLLCIPALLLCLLFICRYRAPAASDGLGLLAQLARHQSNLQEDPTADADCDADCTRFTQMYAMSIVATSEQIEKCWICGDGGRDVVRVQHLDDSSTCTCLVHPSCLQSWVCEHETKGTRIRVCPACRCKRKGWQPKRKITICGWVLPDGTCCQKTNGHEDLEHSAA